MKALFMLLMVLPLSLYAQQQDATGGIGGTGANEDEEIIGGIGGTGVRDIERPELLERPESLDVRDILDDVQDMEGTGSDEFLPDIERPEERPNSG